MCWILLHNQILTYFLYFYLYFYFFTFLGNLTAKRTNELPRDCLDIIMQMGQLDKSEQSIYTPKNNVRKRVVCDLETQGGGWTVCIETGYRRRRRGGQEGHVPYSQISGKMFSGKCHEKFRHFRANIVQNSGILVLFFFDTYIFGQNCPALPKLTQLLRL